MNNMHRNPKPINRRKESSSESINATIIRKDLIELMKLRKTDVLYKFIENSKLIDDNCINELQNKYTKLINSPSIPITHKVSHSLCSKNKLYLWFMLLEKSI